MTWGLLQVLLVLGLLSAPSIGAAGGVLRFSDTLDLTTLNPFLANSSNVSTLSELTMAHLVGYDADGHLVPKLTSAIPTKANGGISTDGRTLIYHLRRDARWSDGVPFTADDVVFTAAVIRNPNNNTTASGAAAWQDIVSIERRDRWTVLVRLRRPNIEVPATLLAAGNLTCILPKHAFASTTINRAPYNGLPIGIGPFRYSAFRRGDAVEMEANPYWYGARPKLRKIVYKIIPDYTTALNELQTGELDLLYGINGVDIERVRTIPGKHFARYLDFFISGLFINVTNPPTDDPVVRRALRLATDRPAIFARSVHGNGALTESVIPKILPVLCRPAYRSVRSGAQAGALLEADGWEGSAMQWDPARKNGVQLVVNVALPSGYQPAAQTIEQIRSNWKAAGVLLDAHAYGVGMFFARAAEGGIVEGGKFNGALFSTEIPEYSAFLNAFGCGGDSAAWTQLVALLRAGRRRDPRTAAADRRRGATRASRAHDPAARL